MVQTGPVCRQVYKMKCVRPPQGLTFISQRYQASVLIYSKAFLKPAGNNGKYISN